ncbi:pyridoxamine 5'-phosphate oxidase [Pleomorphovibrio marinus]|uniref:pyridoxamine 5'-phosphate oxidase n=1 Tax=Pleomorphovibrio marinus TaxID=2164132 RepID=UPI000E0A9FEF|nr:pyridoxamine 5'-phosphate oxidase [Pleomorphovibrio marinus]
MDLKGIRKEYSSKKLEINEVDKNPIAQFKLWLKEALESQVNEPNAMHLATVGTDGKPSGRVVLLKGVEEGFDFFTNYQSQKSKELEHTPYASLTFFWPELERQVRVEGHVEKISKEESEAYFLSRPIESQIGAWSSPQSEEIPDREYLERIKREMEIKFSKEPLEKPDHWGGFRLYPHRLEFWQGRPGRLHDRILFSKNTDGAWKIGRLAP